MVTPEPPPMSLTEADSALGPRRAAGDDDEKYSLLFGNNYWYVCLRLHHLLCERLVVLRSKGREIAAEKADEKRNERADSTAEALRLRKPCEFGSEPDADADAFEIILCDCGSHVSL